MHAESTVGDIEYWRWVRGFGSGSTDLYIHGLTSVRTGAAVPVAAEAA